MTFILVLLTAGLLYFTSAEYLNGRNPSSVTVIQQTTITAPTTANVPTEQMQPQPWNYVEFFSEGRFRADLGEDPVEGYDLHATISVHYVYNGGEQFLTRQTPFTVQANIGNPITVTIVAVPTSGCYQTLTNGGYTDVPCNFACLWNNYGVGEWQGCGSFTTQVHSGPDFTRIVAYFEPP
jgi:hypothetical protein